MVTLHITNRLFVINVELYKESILETLATEIALVMIPNVVCGIWSLSAGFSCQFQFNYIVPGLEAQDLPIDLYFRGAKFSFA